jgi:hypothetical protein
MEYEPDIFSGTIYYMNASNTQAQVFGLVSNEKFS